MPTPNGYPSQKKADNGSSEFVTVSPIAPLKYGLDVALGGTVFNDGEQLVEAGSTLTEVVLTGHNAKVGDKLRFTSGANINHETSVIKIVDANTVRVSPELLAVPAVSDTYDLLKPVTLTLGEDGSFSGPTKFILDGDIQDVTEDTVDPANNRPLPVKLTSFTGDINITANDLNVQLSHNSGVPDSTQIGDGTEIMLINPAGEAQVSDDAARVSLASIDVDTTTIAADTTSLDTKVDVNLSTRASELTLAAADVKLGNIQTDTAQINADVDVPLSTRASETTLAAADTKLATIVSEVTSIDNKIDVNLSTRSTEATALLAEAHLGNIDLSTDTLVNLDTNLASRASESTLAALNAKVVTVDTDNVTVVSSVLPTGASTEAKQDNIITELQEIEADVEATNTSVQAVDTSVQANTTAVNTVNTNVVANTVAVTAGNALLTTIDADTSALAALDTGAGPVGATTRRVHLTDEALAALEEITVMVTSGDVHSTFFNATETTPLPGTGGAFLEAFSTTAQDTQKIQVLDTTGAFFGVYVGAAASEALKFIVGPGSDQTIDVTIPSGSRISLRRLDSADDAVEGQIAINLIG